MPPRQADPSCCAVRRPAERSSPRTFGGRWAPQTIDARTMGVAPSQPATRQRRRREEALCPCRAGWPGQCCHDHARCRRGLLQQTSSGSGRTRPVTVPCRRLSPRACRRWRRFLRLQRKRGPERPQPPPPPRPPPTTRDISCTRNPPRYILQPGILGPSTESRQSCQHLSPPLLARLSKMHQRANDASERRTPRQSRSGLTDSSSQQGHAGVKESNGASLLFQPSPRQPSG